VEDAPTGHEFVEAFVRNRDVACPTCKYNLRDLTSGVCPECGETLVLRLQAEQPRTAVLVMGLLPLAMALGFFTIVTIFVWGISLWEGFGFLGPEFFVPPVLAVVFGMFTLAWVRRWAQVRRWPRGGRVAMVSACWVAMGVGAFAFLAVLLTL
jgi:predicted RNA-binding Zn-ribbon protein involved in translation (DUF1610 family)